MQDGTVVWLLTFGVCRPPFDNRYASKNFRAHVSETGNMALACVHLLPILNTHWSIAAVPTSTLP